MKKKYCTWAKNQLKQKDYNPVFIKDFYEKEVFSAELKNNHEI